MMKPIFFLFLLVAAIPACAPPAKPVRRTLDCYVRYLETEGQVRAEAMLQEGVDSSTTRPVEIPGGLRYQGVAMRVLPVQGLTYRLDFPGAYRPDHVFTWRDAAGQDRRFELSMPSITKFGFTGPTLLRSKPAAFHWEGGALQKGETLVLLWENEALGQTVPMEIYSNAPESSIEFPAAKLSELSPGRWTLYVVRKKLVQSQADGLALSARLEFYSQTDTLQVE